MSIQHNHSRLHGAARRFGGSALALAGMLSAAGCASSGTSAGTYYPPTSTTIVRTGGSWVGEPSGVHINVDLSERKLYLKNGDEVVQSYSIGVGKDAMPTPQGKYSVRRIVWNPPWTPPDAAWAADKEPQAPGARDNPMKVVKIYFNEPDYYIHGTGSVASLGEAVSHGCLRMAPSDAASLARYLMEHGGEARDAAWFQRVESSNDTQTVMLDTAIPMHVGP
jgi:lipoprotein-anchoring transpeptidase ErfK/SrfK